MTFKNKKLTKFRNIYGKQKYKIFNLSNFRSKHTPSMKLNVTYRKIQKIIKTI